MEDRFAGAVTLHDAFTKAVSTESELAALMHPEVVRRNVHLFKVGQLKCSLIYICVDSSLLKVGIGVP